MQCRGLAEDLDRAGGRHRDSLLDVHWLVLSSTAGVILWEEAGEHALVAQHSASMLEKLDNEPAGWEERLDYALAEVAPRVALTGRQLLMTLCDLRAKACLKLCPQPPAPPAHLAAADAALARLVAEDPLRSRHYMQLFMLRYVQGRDAEAAEAARTQLRLATEEKGEQDGWMGQWAGWRIAGALARPGRLMSACMHAKLAAPTAHPALVAAWNAASGAAATVVASLLMGTAGPVCSRSELRSLLAQCREAADRCREWQPSALHEQLLAQHKGFSTQLRELEARHPGQELLPTAAVHGPQDLIIPLLRRSDEEHARAQEVACGACGAREVQVGHLKRCGRCRAVH